MSIYSLTEAYCEIYDHRKAEDLFDNLRFVDYMLQEDIEQVVEELVWEYRDYGNNLEESFNIIEYSLQDRVICESYEELIQDILYEATVTRSTRVPLTSSTGRSSTPSTGSSKITLGRGGMQTPSGSSKVTSSNRFDQNEVNRRANRIGRIRSAKQSVKSRISSLSGPISSVKQSISGAAGGMGRAAKALGGEVVKRGRVMLKSLLRRGGKALTSAGRSIEGSGKAAAAAPATTRTAKVGRTTVTTTTEPGGAKRQAVGRAVRRVGVALQKKAGKAPEPKMSRADYYKRKSERTASAKKEVGDAFANPGNNKKISYKIGSRMKTSRMSPGIKPAASGYYSVGTETPRYADGSPAGPSRTWRKYGQDSDSPKNAPSRFKSPRASTGISRASSTSRPTSSARKYPTEPSGQTTLFTKPVKAKSVGQDIKVPVGGQKKFGKAQKSKPTERTRQTSLLSRLREDYDVDLLLQYISEDLIDAGYAYNIDEAYEIINDLDESTLTEIIYDYLEE